MTSRQQAGLLAAMVTSVLSAACSDSSSGAEPHGDGGDVVSISSDEAPTDLDTHHAADVPAIDTADLEPAWPEPPDLTPDAPRLPGIQNCASIFIDPDGVCRPTTAACGLDQLAIPTVGCVTPKRVPVEVPPGAATFDVFNDDEVAAGIGPGLGEVVALAPAGSVLQLRAGRVRGDVVIDKALILQGQGVGVTVLVGTSEVDDTLSVHSATVLLTDLTVEGARNGVEAVAGATLTLERVFLSGFLTVFAHESELILRDTRVTEARHAALQVDYSHFDLERVNVPTGGEGCGLVFHIENPSSVVRNSVVEGPGAACWEGTGELSVSNSRIGVVDSRSTVTYEHVFSDGFVRWGPSPEYVIRHSRIEGQLMTTSRLDVADSIVVFPDGLLDDQNVSSIQLGPGSTLERVVIDAGRGDAITMNGLQAEPAPVTLRHVRILTSKRGLTRPGVAIRAEGLVTYDLDHVTIEAAENIGILATTLSTVNAHALHIDGGPSNDAGAYRFGIMANSGATITLTDSVISRSVGIGVWLKDQSSRLTADGLWLDEIAPGILQDIDQGKLEGIADAVLVGDGATATLSDLWVRAAGRASVFSASGNGLLGGGHLTQCEFGMISSKTFSSWQIENLENDCLVPFQSDSEQMVPRRLRL